MELAELIAGLERASRPDPVLDDAIHELMPKPKVVVPLRYTASIDDALSMFESMPRGLHLYRNTAPDMGSRDWVVSHTSPTMRVAARSWPLAICIAALKAR